MKTYKTYKDLYDYIKIDKNTNRHSHYRNGVLTIAMMMLEPIISSKPDSPLPTSWDVLKDDLLNGADNFRQYAFTGNPYAYDEDIAKLLLSPSLYKCWNGGHYIPGHQKAQDMTFLDMQYFAVRRAFNAIERACKVLNEKKRAVHIYLPCSLKAPDIV